MSDPVSAIRSLPRFAYLSPAEAREVVLAVLGAVDVEVMARAHYDASRDERVGMGWDECHPAYREQQVRTARAMIDALVAEVQEEGR